MSARMSRRAGLLGVLTAAAVVVMASPAVALPPFGTAPVNGSGFGGVGPGKQVTIQSVTVGRHAGFDRVVITSKDGLPSFTVRYVSQVTQDASGAPVPLLGSAFLEVTLRPTSTEVHAPQNTVTPGFPALKQVKGAGDFEAVTSYGIGQAATSGFRVFTLTGPDRIVIDLAAPAGAAPASTGTKSGGESSANGTSGGGQPGGGALPNTGFPTLPAAGLGAALLLAGLAAYGLSRRHTAT
jgi:LPXTG-motif cell wall-anchored protein